MTSDSPPSLAEMARTWARIGLTSFGGPAGQIALMHKILVEDKKWIGEREYLHALNLCMLLPGPEAQQLATYVGWKLQGWRGGLIAGWLFVLPGALVMLGLSLLYVTAGHFDGMKGLFFGIQAVVLAVVLEALLRVARRALTTQAAWIISGFAFIGLFLFNLPFPLVIAMAAVAGALFLPRPEVPQLPARSHKGHLTQTFMTLVIGLSAWVMPLVLIALTLGTEHTLWQVGLLFSKMAVITFGGAYAVLTYAGQEAVGTYGWLTTPEMVQGLGLAETTPGPLILTLQYIGFLAGFRNPAPFSPLTGGLLAAALTTWVTFVPCFLWIFLTAPHMETLQRQPRLTAALSGITAAVVGVILSLSLWLAMHVVFRQVATQDFGPLHLLIPQFGSLDLKALGIAVIAAFALLRFHVGLLKVLLFGAVAGIALAFTGL